MKNLIQNLILLQTLETDPSRAPDRSTTAKELRTRIPANLLATYDRLNKRKRTPVAGVRHGVCSGCHIKIPVGVLGALARYGVQQCSNCGRLVYLEDDALVDRRSETERVHAE